MAAALAIVALLATPSRAQPPGEAPDWSAREPLPITGQALSPFTIAPLVGDALDRLGTSNEALRIHLIEQIRAEGWPVTGAENPLFGQDQSDDARFVLGGEVFEPYPATRGKSEGTGIDVRWELLDRRTEQVVYEVTTRGWVPRPVGVDSPKLLTIALFNVLARPRLVEALNAPFSGSTLPEQGLATLRRCPSPPVRLPDAFDQVLPAVVAIQNGAVTGSGVVVSPDGFVITAAHLVEGAEMVEVTLHQGPVLAAEVLQYDTDHDVALLHMNGSNFACTAIAHGKPGIGQPVYLVGSPRDTRLRSSVSSGVVSGVRLLDDVELLQTDAASSPGSSGGPMLDTRGALVGVTSSKVAGVSVEGVSFTIPTDAVERWLGLQFGERSAVPTRSERSQGQREPLEDQPDPPLVPRDARICLFQRDGGAATTFDVSGVPVTLGARQYACVAVPSGTVRVGRAGNFDTRVRLRPQSTAYLLVVGRTLSRAGEAEFERARSKGLVDVSGDGGAP